MAEIQIDKVKSVLSRMDETYWNGIVGRCSVLGNQATRLTTDFSDTFTKLTTTQLSIIEAKYNGYKLLAENKKKSAVAGIVNENKDRIGQLIQEKYRLVTALTDLLAEAQTIIDEAQTFGEVAAKTPSSKEGDNN